jgi:hypothetical protein
VTDRAPTLAWCLLFLPLVVVGLATLWWPLGRDQGIYAWVGSVVADGGAPYVDAWDVKGPATYLVYAVTQQVFGSGMWGIRLVDLLLLGGAGWLAWRGLARTGAGAAALLAPWLCAAWYWQLGWWHSAQPDSWIGLALLAALSLTLLDRERARPAIGLGVGALVGACALLKPLYGCMLAVPALHAWLDQDGRRRAAWRWALWAGIGFAGTVGAVFAWLGVKGALGEFFRIQLEFNRVVHSADRSLGLVDHLRRLYHFALPLPHLLALPLAMVGAVAAWRQQRRFVIVAVAALLLAVAAVVLQAKYYEYHLVPLDAPLALLAAIGLGRLVADGPAAAAWRRPLAAVLLLIVVGVNLAALWPEARSWLRHVGGDLPRRDYYARFTKPDYSYQQCRFVATKLRESTAEDDTVLVWALDPVINYLSGRMPPTRFGVHYPLTRGARNPFENEWRRRFLADLEARPPAAVVVADGDGNNLLPKPSIRYLDDFPVFRRWLQRNYTPDIRAGRYYVWRRSTLPTEIEPL